MGFRGPNKALTKSGFKRPNWSHLGRGTKREGEGEEKRKRKKKKRRRGRRDQAKKVWKLTLVMDFMRLCMDCHAWLVSSLSPNLGFC